jgi:quinolinate synthase
MAETASILCPDKTVLLPQPDAGCPMADMVTPEKLKQKLTELPPMPVVTYVNSTAAVKALSTICCTSANAVDVVNSLAEQELLMIPDRNLAQYTASRTNKKIHLWDGFCPFHNNLTVAALEKAKAAHPAADVMIHPECPPDAIALADTVQSTSGMLRYARQSDKTEFIVATEVGMLYPLKKEMPHKNFYPASEKMICPDMKKITVDDIITSLENRTGQVNVPEEIRQPALAAVRKMINLSL